MKTYLHKIGMTLALVMVTVMGWGQTYSPTKGATNVSTSPIITLTFSTGDIVTFGEGKYIYIQPKTGTPLPYYTGDSGDGWSDPKPPSSQLSISGNTLTIDLSTVILTSNTTYRIYPDAGAILVNGVVWDGLRVSPYWTFTTQASIIPPTITTWDPVKGATGVETNKTIELTFNETIKKGTDVGAYIQLRKTSDNTGVTYGVSDENVSIDAATGKTLSINPTVDLSGTTEYYVLISSNYIQSQNTGAYFAGIDNSTSNNYRFTTAPAPAKWATGYTSITNQTKDALSLNGKVDTDGTYYYIVSDSYTTPTGANVKSATGAFLSGNGTATANAEFSKSIALNTLTSEKNYFIYTVVENSGGFSEVKQSIFYHDSSAPVATFSPADGATGVPTTTTIVVTLSENIYTTSGTIIDASNIQSLITLKTGDNAVSFTATIDNKIIVITPSSSLLEGTTYQLTIAIVEDNYGNEQSLASSMQFITDKTNIWTGATDTNWEVPTNWESGKAPSTGSVVIPSGLTKYPVINNEETFVISNLEIGASASLEIETGGSLTVNKKLNMLSSPSRNASLLNNGTLSYTASLVSIHQGITQEVWDYYISSPVFGANQTNIGCDGGIFKHTMPNSWLPMSPTEELIQAKGYVAWGTSGSDLIFRGAINNGEYTFNATRTVTPNNFGWNLAGNPYPCSIDWELIAPENMDNMTDGFWLWLNDSQSFGTYNGVAELGTNVSELGASLIPSNHAFWTQVLLPNPNISNTTGSITITKASRANNTTSYLKSAGSKTNRSVLRFEGVNGTLNDETVIALIDGAGNGYDQYDSDKKLLDYDPEALINSNLVQLYTTTGTTKCAINSYDLNSFTGDMTIPMGYKAIYASSGVGYGIRLKSFEGFPEDLIVELEDTKEQTKIIMTPSSIYCFESKVANTDDASRFLIHLKSASLSTANRLSENQNNIKVYSEDNVIFIDTPELNNPTYQLYDVNGQIIGSGNLNSSEINKIEVNKTGIIVVKVISTNGIFTSKVLIK